MQPGISVRAGFDDNIRLTTDDREDEQETVWETSVTPRVQFGAVTETRGVTGMADYSIRRFHGGSGVNSSSELDREDAHLNLASFLRTERNDLGLSFNFTRDSTLDSELDETGDAISARATRLRYVLQPRWSYVLTPRTWLNLNYSYTKVDYQDDPGVSNLTEFEYHAFSTSLVRALSERISATASASYSLYKPETNLDSKTTSLEGGLSVTLSETMSASFLAGWRNTTSDQFIPTGVCVSADPGASFPECNGGFTTVTGTSTDESDNDGTVYSFNIDKQLYEGSLSASLVRRATPSGREGRLLETITLSISAERQLWDRLRGSITAQATDRETITSTTSGVRSDKENRKFYTITPQLTWKWRQNLDLSAFYRYRNVEQDVSSDNATSNAFYLTLNYRLPRMAVSR